MVVVTGVFCAVVLIGLLQMCCGCYRCVLCCGVDRVVTDVLWLLQMCSVAVVWIGLLQMCSVLWC